MDRTAKETNFEYDLMDRIIKVKSAKGIKEIEYNALGKIKKVKDEKGNETKYSYDLKSNLIEIENAKLLKTRYKYNWREKLTEVYQVVEGAESNEETKLEVIKGNGYTIRKPIKESDSTQSEVSDVATIYKYNKKGLLIEDKDTLGQVTDIENKRKNLTEKYLYDQYGNRIKKDYTKDMKQIKTEYEYDQLNRLQKIKSKNEEILGYEIKDEVTISYDCRGNMTLIKSSKGENIGEFIYDAKNKLIRTTTHKNIIADYCYNGIGQRVKKEIDGKIYEYVLDITSEFNDILEVKTSSSANVNTTEEPEKYIYGVKYPVGSKLIGTTKGRELESIYMNDELGSVIRVINLNKEIEVGKEQRKALIEYNTFGKEREYKNRTTNKISIIKSFTGYEEDKETGLDFVQARYYMKDI